MAAPGALPATADEVAEGLRAVGYLPGESTALVAFLATRLGKPVLVEGPAGVGKTELAKTAAAWLGLPLVRMQCYEGLDESKALYEWKYGKQLLYTQILKDRLGAALGEEPGLDAALERLHGFGDLFFSERFLEPRPLLRALRDAGFDEGEIWDIAAIAAFFSMSNRLANATELRPNREFHAMGRG